MLNLSSELDFHLYLEPTDMRKGFNGLSGVIRNNLEEDPSNGAVFIS